MRISLRLFLGLACLAATSSAFAQVRVSITVGPPPLPVYEQPIGPGDGYLWTPGYWAWDDFAGGYYWVPGTWILPPRVGLLWTPGYWAWRDTSFVFVDGYWGPVVGFYGGIDYGFGYPGHGYYGGRWTGNRFFYNRSVSNVNVTVVRNTYVENVTVARSPNRVSYNGRDGIAERPTASEAAAAKAGHVAPTAAQVQHVQQARSTPNLHAKENQGRPPVAATERPQTLQSRPPGGSGRESPQDRSSDARSTGSTDRATAPPTRPEQPSVNRDRSPTENGRADQGGRSEPRRDEPRSPPAAGRARPGEDPAAANARDADRPRPQPRSAPPQTRQEQPSSPQSGRPEQRSEAPRPPPAAGGAQSGDNRSRAQQGSKTREGKQRSKDQDKDQKDN